MTYREHVHRALSVHHARIEQYLAKARDQEAFANHVCARLTQHHIAFQFTLNSHLDVQIRLSSSVSGSLPAIFRYEGWHPTPNGVILSHRDGAQVELFYESHD